MEDVPVQCHSGAGAEISPLLSLPPDCFSRCLSHLSLRDIARLSQTCRTAREATSADEVWNEKWRLRWPLHIHATNTPASLAPSVPAVATKQCFVERIIDINRLSFWDYSEASCEVQAEAAVEQRGQRAHAYHRQPQRTRTVTPVSKIVSITKALNRGHDYPRGFCEFAAIQGSNISVWSATEVGGIARDSKHTDHTGRVTALVPFSVPASSALARGARKPGACGELHEYDEHLLFVTASLDRTVKLWGKSEKPLRTLTGHSSPVVSLSDSMLAQPADASGAAIIASGAMDGGVRVWSLGAQGKGKSACIGTLLGHAAPVVGLSVHGDGALVSVDSSGKVQFWSSLLRCLELGRSTKVACSAAARVPWRPFAVQAAGSLCFVAGEGGVAAFDVRTFEKVFTCKADSEALASFAAVPSNGAFWCGGEGGSVSFCDCRVPTRAVPLQAHKAHEGPVTQLLADASKAVSSASGGDALLVWDSVAGEQLQSFPARPFPAEGPEEHEPGYVGISAVDCEGPCLVLAATDGRRARLEHWDFQNGWSKAMAAPTFGREGRFWEVTTTNDF